MSALAQWEERITDFDQIYAEALADAKTQPEALFKKAYEGAVIATSYAEILLNRAIRQYGRQKEIGYPDTAYHLPVILALSGEKVTTLEELIPILNRVRSQVKERYSFDQARLCGEATLYAAEIIEVLHYLDQDEPKPSPWTGFISDPDVRRYGIKLVDWTIPGQAVILGRAKTSEDAAKLVSELMSKGMMIFLSDEIIEQLLEQDMKIGTDYICFPLGNFTQVIHAVNYALRAGVMFGGIPGGERHNQRDYQHRRVRAFVLQLGEFDQVKVAAHMGAVFLGFPVITDQELAEEIPDWYVSHTNYDDLIKFAMELRGIKVTSVDIPIPLNFGPAFEGETIRRADVAVEFGGGRSQSFEVVRMVGIDEVEDEKVEVIGPDIDEFEEGDAVPLGIMVDIYGRKMQEDFESVLERRIHYFVNFAEGLWHVAQRDLAWIRVSKEAKAKGFQFRHFGDILIAKLKSEFPAIVDRVQVRIITDPAVVEENLAVARKIYLKRDDRLRGLTDDAVEDFYSCILCQSFAPNHVCVVTPERVGLCGAVSWLDGKASYEINPSGPNPPIPKGRCLDEERGIWESVDEYVYTTSNRSVDGVCLYTLMEKPMTSCGCFEAIMAIVPEANGIMISTRESSKLMTPVGMTFSTLAGVVGGGNQTPGFMGIGRTYVVSRKFIKADGGIARIIWMPKELKEFLRQDFVERSIEEGLGEDFIDKIADEDVGTEVEEILAFLEEKEHPCFTLDPLM